MEVIYLDAEIRQDGEVGKSHLLRKTNFVPCVVYGEGKKTVPIKIERGHLIKFMHAHHGGENMVITLRIAGGSKKGDERAVLIKEVQKHPVSGDILHLDFNEISLTKKIEVQVPIEAKGEAVGVKQEGGTLEHILWEVEVECLPTAIPEKIEVDVTALKIGDIVHVKDLVLPTGVVLKHDPEGIVFHLVAPHVEELETPGGAEGEATSAEPEVIKKEKKAEEEEESAGKEEGK